MRRTLVVLAIILMPMLVASCSDSKAPTPATNPSKAETPQARLEELTRRAQSGDPAAQFELGIVYAEEKGAPANPQKAAEWFQKAATQGNAKAQATLGRMYRDGDGVTRDDSKAVDWLQKAAAQGVVEAQAYLGMIYRRGDGVPQDDTKGVELCRKAAEQGNAFAQTCLGSAYQYGSGVGKDLEKALDLYLKAASQGDGNASTALYLLHENGEGIPKSPEKAMEWLRKAADQGDAWAQYMLALRYERGKGVPQDLALAVEWYKKAAAQGDPSAQARLAVLYARGEGLPRDLVLAYAWFNLAASSEFETTSKKLAVRSRAALEDSLSRTQMAEAERLSSGWKRGIVLAREEVGASGGIQGNLRKRSTGTLFVVNTAGLGVTNQHVIQGCKELRVEGRDGVAKVITEDLANDLALVQLSGNADAAAPIASDSAKLRQGDDVVVFGFPLKSVLSSGGNLTPGVVSAVTGLGNNTNQIQITAPIQSGSSGSPVMNKRGEVTGVISMKLSDAKMAAATGSVGQNVNFAVNGQTLKAFLDSHRVAYSSGGGWFLWSKSLADIGDEARRWTFVVECWG